MIVTLRAFVNNIWINGMCTLLDASYLLEDIPPVSYYVQVTPLDGYHLPNDHPWRDDEFDSDSDFDSGRKSKCLDFTTAGGRAVTFDAGLIPGDAVLVGGW